ncbi:MAG: RsmD family RNA methyltransferase [Fidelibacterota bacterium]
MTANSTTIVGGHFKGTRIRTGRGNRIRPTLSRVRKAIFDLLPDLSGKDVLDLYAGAGTLGFEALSRGASSVTFVERDSYAARLVEKNSLLFEEGRTTIVRTGCHRFLERTKRSWDIILADPPYGDTDLSDLKEKAMGRLKPGGILVMETSVRQPWEDDRAITRRYGDTRVSLIPGEA